VHNISLKTEIFFEIDEMGEIYYSIEFIYENSSRIKIALSSNPLNLMVYLYLQLEANR